MCGARLLLWHTVLAVEGIKVLIDDVLKREGMEGFDGWRYHCSSLVPPGLLFPHCRTFVIVNYFVRSASGAAGFSFPALSHHS